MTENLKTNLMLVFATVLTVLALLYGFSTIPSPAKQRDLKLDHKRVTDLGELQYSIDEYYRTNYILPASLNEVKPTSYSYLSKELSKTDPETNQPYEYSKISDKKYQLCATFTTDSESDMDEYDSENYSYSSYKNKFKHPEGRYCFELDTPVVYRPYPSPTFYMLPPLKPISSPVPSLTQ